MAVTLECELVVGLRALRQAIAAVVPHAEPTKTGDEISKLSRVRITAGKDELLVMATNSVTVAMAAVEIEEDSRSERFAADDGIFSIDAMPGHIRSILASFKVSRPTADADEVYAQVQISGQQVKVLDTAGMLPGMPPGFEITFPTLGLADGFPDIPGILQRTFSSAMGSPGVKPLISEAKPLALFRHAAVAYGQALTFEPTGTAESRGWAVWCGSQFAGLISSTDPSGNSLGHRDQERQTILRRLGLDKPVRVVS